MLKVSILPRGITKMTKIGSHRYLLKKIVVLVKQQLLQAFMQRLSEAQQINQSMNKRERCKAVNISRHANVN